MDSEIVDDSLTLSCLVYVTVSEPVIKVLKLGVTSCVPRDTVYDSVVVIDLELLSVIVPIVGL